MIGDWRATYSGKTVGGATHSSAMRAKFNPLSVDIPKIMIDSGESISVVGDKWIQSWQRSDMHNLKKRDQEFHVWD